MSETRRFLDEQLAKRKRRFSWTKQSQRSVVIPTKVCRNVRIKPTEETDVLQAQLVTCVLWSRDGSGPFPRARAEQLFNGSAGLV